MSQPTQSQPTQKQGSDVVNEHTGQTWVYSKTVKDHFFHPQNLLLEEPKEDEFDARGTVGSPACGDVMDIWIKVDQKEERITDLKWKTFGCGSAIASTSMFSVMITENGGMKIEDALKIKPQHVMERLGGLPNRKIHCSVLADKAFKKTVNNWFHKTGQHGRVMVEGKRVIDAATNTTDKDIEEAVLEGAQTLEEVQKKLKVAVGASHEVKLEVEQLIRFYSEKYYG